MLQTQNIIKQYANHRALDCVSVDVPEGCIYGLLGPNGAGKTTLIRIVNQIIAPDSGAVLLNGKPITPEDVRHIGYLPEERGLYKKMKVGEQALYLAQLKGMSQKEARKRIEYWFDRLEIDGWWNKKVEELSKGMQQKVQFVTTVVHEPKLLIFDEPFSGFDPVNAALLKREILELKKNGATIMLSTHNMNSVEELCDEITLIDRSKVVLQGKVEEIRNQFRSNIFRIIIRGENIEVSAGDPFTILQTNLRSGNLEVRLQKEENISVQQLIKMLIERYEVIAFEEELPGMEDIFIKVVNHPNE
ncbi:ABC transporter ATP-binding protein [Parabacteroides sp. FAFU027]|uniref:ABC transporter ATP-binding protein n=1 Tax=Parabacteroides sp. FAFU027 TaxID=2922715 RepID=UPI001FAFE810|nr:ABC transporter ATP-binding protein [Parabacteroides sp. FAFU027]